MSDDRCKPAQDPGQGAIVRVGAERETEHGWAFDVSILRPGAPETQHDLRLSWVDHDLWSGGRAPPSRTAEALMKLLVGSDLAPDDLPARFDASTARRWLPGVDRELPQLI